MSYYDDYDDIKKLEEYYDNIDNDENEEIDPDLYERFPSVDEIYRKDNLIEFNHIVFKHLDTVIDTIINDKKFQEFVFNENTLDLKSIAFTRIISLMKQCAIELLYKMLVEVLEGVVDREVLNDLAGACLSLSIKLYGSHDWIYSGNVLNGIFYKARDEGIILDLRVINIMERDIMKNTDWKGCPTFYLNKKYDTMFQDSKD